MNLDVRTSPLRALRGQRIGCISSTADLSSGVILTLAATSEAPMLARRAAGAALADWARERRDMALLVISELVTNAVRHGSADASDRVGLRVGRHGGATRIEVTDRRACDDEIPLVLGRDGAGRRSGWGLPIVAELVDRWGVEHEISRTRVWCEIDDA